MSKFYPLKLVDRSYFSQLVLLAFFVLLFTSESQAQEVPQAINYQAIVRDAGTYLPVSDQAAYVTVEFLNGPDGDVVYQEEFTSLQTGKSGLINLSLGQGNPLISSFSSIPWESGSIWLRLSVDIGSGLNILQETPFNTVPYAFYAQSSGGADDDGDPNNELIQSINLDAAQLEITEGDEIISVDLSSLINDDDSDPTNEKIDSLQYNAETGILSVFESGVQYDVDLPINEIDPAAIQDLSYDADQHILTITNNEAATPVDLGPYLDNTDVQTLSLNNTVITISGSESSIDLADLLNTNVDLDGDPNNEIQNLSLSADSLFLSGSSGVDLSGYLDNTDNQALTLIDSILSLSGDVPTSVNLASILEFAEDGDSDDSNEIQDISTDSSPGNISISGGSSLTLNVDDADADDSNEIQDLSLSGNTLSLTDDGTTVDLSGYLDNTDNQDLTLSGTTLSLTNDGTPVDLSLVPGIGDDADADPSNEIQDISTDKSAGNITISDGSTITLNVDDADADATNEIQDLSLSGNTLSLTDDGTTVDLSGYLDNTDNQDLTLSGTTLSLTNDGTPVDLSLVPGIGDDADADPSNEIQDISTDNSAGNITISDGSTLTLNVDDADADATNEIQDLSLSGNTLSLTNDGTTVDLSGYLDNTDNQDLTLSGTTLSLTNDGTPVDLSLVPGIGDDADADPSNEIQDISTDNSAGNITISDGSTITLNVDDADADATNEIQDLSLSGNTLSLTDDGTTVDLSGYLDNTDNQDLTLSGTTLSLTNDGTPVDLSLVPGIGDDADADPSNEIQDISTDNSAGNIAISDGSTITLNVDDADADATNEIQDLSLSGNTLSLSGTGTTVDLSDFDNSNLSQNHIFLGDASGEAQEVLVSGDINLADDGEITVTGLQSVDVSNTTPTDGQILVYDGATEEWKPETPASVGPVSTVSYYNIDPLDFRELTDPSNGVNLNRHDALKFFNEEAPFAMVRSSNGIDAIAAAVHLPHGATVTRVRVYFRDWDFSGDMQFRFVRKNITNASDSNEIMSFINGAGAFGNAVYTDNTIVNAEIDNSIYNYRFIADFSYLENNNDPDENFEMLQRIYGVVIEYTIN